MPTFHPSLLAAALAILLALGAAPAIAGPQPEGQPLGMRGVYAYTLKHQPAHEALAHIRPLLSPEGTVEVQPQGNTLVIRDRKTHIARILPVLRSFDHPPQDLRFDIRIVRAGPSRQVISPPLLPAPADGGLPADLLARLRELLRYDDYQVLASAAMTSREGDDVVYSLGSAYSVSFRPGTVLAGPAGQRLKLEDFRIRKQVENPTDKGRRLEPQELFHATLNLWIDRPFSLVLTQDESRREALVVAISCRREPGPSDAAEGGER
jgi:hypothetical protein